jgi:hypothetical protein
LPAFQKLKGEVMSLYKNEVIVAIEKTVERQVEASGITGELHRLDGEKIVDAIMEQLEGFVLVPRKLPDEVSDRLWDFMTDNFVCTNEDGDSFMVCGDFDLDELYGQLIEAQEQSHE